MPPPERMNEAIRIVKHPNPQKTYTRAEIESAIKRIGQLAIHYAEEGELEKDMSEFVDPLGKFVFAPRNSMDIDSDGVDRFVFNEQAVLALGHIGPFTRSDEEVNDRLVEILKRGVLHDSALISEIAAWSLGETGNPRAADPLIDRLKLEHRSNAVIRNRAVVSLGKVGESQEHLNALKIFLQKLTVEWGEDSRQLYKDLIDNWDADDESFLKALTRSDQVSSPGTSFWSDVGYSRLFTEYASDKGFSENFINNMVIDLSLPNTLENSQVFRTILNARREIRYRMSQV